MGLHLPGQDPGNELFLLFDQEALSMGLKGYDRSLFTTSLINRSQHIMKDRRKVLVVHGLFLLSGALFALDDE